MICRACGPSCGCAPSCWPKRVRLFCSGQKRTIVSAFFFPSLKAQPVEVTPAGALLRREIREAASESGAHFVAYVRRRAPRRVLDSLRSWGRTVHVYGHGALGRSGNLEFFDIEPVRFVEDLARARALISSAGNQVVGEALALQKPVLAYPQPGNWEQQINAHFLQQSGMGRARSRRANGRRKACAPSTTSCPSWRRAFVPSA